MKRDYSWVIPVAVTIVFIIFAYWVTAQPGYREDMTPTPCENSGNC